MLSRENVNLPPFLRKYKVIFALIMVLVLAFGVGYTVAQTSQSFVISAGLYGGAPSYTVSTNGAGAYYAKNAYGVLSFTDSDAGSLFNDVLDVLSTAGGEIFVTNGEYFCYTPIVYQNTYGRVMIRGESRYSTTLNKQFNGDLITISGTDASNRIPNVDITDIYLYGSSGSYTGDGLVLNWYRGCHVERVMFSTFEGVAFQCGDIDTDDDHGDTNSMRDLYFYGNGKDMVVSHVSSVNIDRIDCGGSGEPHVEFNGVSVVCADNLFLGAYNGLVINATRNTCWSVVINSAQVETTEADDIGILITRSAGNRVKSVQINGYSVYGTGTGLSAEYCDDVSIENCYFSAALTTAVDIGTDADLDFEGNYGYVTENNGTSTGTGAEQTIAHGLVGVPDRVNFVPTVTGATVSGWWADATNIYVTVTSGKTYNWFAEID